MVHRSKTIGLAAILFGVFFLLPQAMAVEILLEDGRTINALEIYDSGDYYVLNMGGTKLAIFKARIEKIDDRYAWGGGDSRLNRQTDDSSPDPDFIAWSELEIIKRYYDYMDHLDHPAVVDLLLDAIERYPEYYECHKLLSGFYEENYRTESQEYLYVLCRMLSRFDKIENIHIRKKLLANIRERIRRATLAFANPDQLFDDEYTLDTVQLNEEYAWEYFGRLMYLVRLYAIVHSFDIDRDHWTVERSDLLTVMADHIKGERWSFTTPEINALSVLYLLESHERLVPDSIKNYVIINYKADLRQYLLDGGESQWENLAYRYARYLNARHAIIEKYESIYDASHVDLVLDDCLEMATLSSTARWGWVKHNVPDKKRVEFTELKDFGQAYGKCDSHALDRLLKFYDDNISDDYCFFVWSRGFSRALESGRLDKGRKPYDEVVAQRMEYIKTSVRKVNPQFLGASRFIEYMNRLAPAVSETSGTYQKLAKDIEREELAYKAFDRLVGDFCDVNVKDERNPDRPYHLSSIIQGEFKQPEASLVAPLKAELIDQRSRFYVAAVQYESTAWGGRIKDLYGLIDNGVKAIEKVEDDQRKIEKEKTLKLEEARKAEELARRRQAERKRKMQAHLNSQLPLARESLTRVRRVVDSYLVQRRNGESGEEYWAGETNDRFPVVNKWEIKAPTEPSIRGDRVICRCKVLVDGNKSNGDNFRMWFSFVLGYDGKAPYGWSLVDIEKVE